MYDNVLAAVNEHLNSEVAAHYALYLAKLANARITFCAIAEKGLTDKAFQAAEAAVKRLARAAHEVGVEADCVLHTGDPLEQIKKVVTTEKIGLVFAATRHEDVQKRFYAHTTSRQLSLHLPCSVALVRVVRPGKVHPKTILVPLKARIDHIAERVFFTALMAGAFGARIHLFHATKPMTRFFRGEVHLTPVEWEARLPADISLFVDQLDRYDVSHEKKLIPGRAERSITIEAASKRHDLIIMGASERRPWNSLFRESPVERVLRETICNLIILRPKQ
jgi:nucleotide-binding universal stress UspA family protein